jgi:hypothetical protein
MIPGFKVMAVSTLRWLLDVSWEREWINRLGYVEGGMR